MKMLYIAGAYRGATRELVEANIKRARDAAIECANAGVAFFCPHTHADPINVEAHAPDELYLKIGLRMLDVCTAVYLVPGWEKSAGTAVEIERAEMMGLPVFTDLEAAKVYCHENW